MERVTRRLLLALACLLAPAVSATEAAAQTALPDGSYLVPPNWELTPSRVGAGARFRLLFITSTTRNAQSADIADYNSHVQAAAAAGHAAIQPYSALFSALASTQTVDARDNTATTGTGVSIHWLNGAKVADNYADFYDNNWDNEAAASLRSETGLAGAFSSEPIVWTGSTGSGVKQFVNNLGTAQDGRAMTGRPNQQIGGPINGGVIRAKTQLHPLYALSPVFVTPPADGVFTVPRDWPLTPPGLLADTRFRLLFVTSTTRNAQPTDIAHYNRHVQAAAAAGHEAIRPWSAQFQAVASTSTVDARDNTDSNTATDGAGVPIHWLNGKQVADDYADFYDNAWDNEAVADLRTEAGVAGSSAANPSIWTGTSANGTKAVSLHLGNTNGNSALVGRLDFATGGPIDSGRTNLKSRARRLYALSPLFVTPKLTTPSPLPGSTAYAAPDELTPSGLPDDGAGFRLLFLTSTERNAASKDIADYDEHVQAAAARGHLAIRAYGPLFKALASTPTVDARDHTMTNTATKGTIDVPIHWLGGAKVADDYADFYDNTWDNEAAAAIRSETGMAGAFSNAPEVWTGTAASGVKAFSYHLGSGNNLGLKGRPGSNSGGPIDGGEPTEVVTATHGLYGLSPLFANPPADGVWTVPKDWALTPAAVGPGREFRLLFVTSTRRDATSTDIADYNHHVRVAAGEGHTAIRPWSAQFQAVASTSTVDARDNTDSNTATDGAGVPIHWLNGKQVADDYADFYDNAWDNEAEADLRNEAGAVGAFTITWTGTSANGTKAVSLHLGNTIGNNALVGRPDFASGGPIDGATVDAKTAVHPLYALSPVFRRPPISCAVFPAYNSPTSEPLTITENAQGVWVVRYPEGGRYHCPNLLPNPGGNRNVTVQTFTVPDTDAGNIHIRGDAAGSLTFTNSLGVDDDVYTGDRFSEVRTFYGGTRRWQLWIVEDEPVPPPAITIAPAALTVREGTAASYTVTANRAPAADLTVNLTVAEASGADFVAGAGEGGKTVTIAADATEATFTVATVDDDADEPNAAVTVTVTASTASPVDYTLGGTTSAAVTVTDDDLPIQAVPDNWALKPAGLGPGDRFRLLFITSTARDATSTDIADYNSHARTAAAAGAAAIQPYSAQFTAVASTSTVDARDNTNTNTATTDTDVPIHWLNGPKVADDYADFYDNTWDNEAAADLRTESGLAGAFTADPTLFTGTTSSGVKAHSLHLGTTLEPFALLGRPNHADGGPIDGGIALTLSLSRAFFALSPVFEVTPAAGSDGAYRVPEDWALTPSGLADGARFRLLFITSATRDANSTDIADYDSHVQDAAGAGHAAIRPYGALFKALASTSAVDANAHTATTGAGVPIHWLGGAQVADDYDDFYDNSWDNEAIADLRTETGAAGAFSSAPNANVWTGTTASGGKAVELHLGNTINGDGHALMGRPGPPSGGPIDGAIVAGKDTVLPLYALSPVFFEAATALPSVTIAAGAAVTEGTAARYTVTATPPPAASLTVNYSAADAPFADFVAEGAGTVTVGATGTATISLPTQADAIDEPSGPVTVTLAGGVGYTPGAMSSAAVTVNDNDPTTVTLTTPDPSAAESSTTNTASLVLTLNRGLRSGESLAVPLTFTGGALGTDFTLALSGSPAGVTFSGSTVTFTGPSTGATAAAATVLLSASADADTEDETVTANLGSPTATGLGGGAAGSRDGNGQITLTDTTAPSAITIAAGTSPVREGASASYTVTADRAPVTALTVNLTVAEASGADFVAGDDEGGRTVTIAADATEATFTVATVDDDADEANAAVTVTVTASTATPADYTLGGTTSAAVTVTDDDLPIQAVPDNWALKPAGLAPGDRFRLLFITSTTRNANSTDIADYNSHVRTAAAAGAAAIQPYSAQFTAVASTSTVDARDNTMTNTATVDTDVPIHWLGGPKVADAYADFYDNSWDNETAADLRDESGGVSTATTVWTGTTSNGTKAFSLHLGTATETDSLLGDPGGDGGPIDGGLRFGKGNSRPLYALSPVFEVTPAAGADGAYQVPGDWALTPSGIDYGDKFRLLFITSTTRDAASTDIADYDGHVQDAAGAGHAAIRPWGALFKALASTSAVDARDHTDTNTATDGAGVPIHWLGGAKVADDYAGFYDGVWDNEAVADLRTGSGLAGAFTTAPEIWTGTSNGGVKSTSLAYLGSTTAVVRGFPANALRRPIAGVDTAAPGGLRPLYALSPVFSRPPAAVVTVSPTSLSLIEDNPAKSYTVVLGSDPGAAVAVTATSDDGAAQLSAGGAFDASVRLNFTGGATGNWGMPRTVNVRATPNDGDTADESVSITHASTVAGDTNHRFHGVTIAPVSVAVTDSDGLPTVTFTQSSFSVGEGHGMATITVAKTGSAAAEVSYFTVDNTATAPADYTTTSGVLTWTAGDTADKTFTVPIIEDSLAEGSETFRIWLSAPADSLPPTVLVSPFSAVITILDNETIAELRVTGFGSAARVSEGMSAPFGANLSRSPNAEVVIPLRVKSTSAVGAGEVTIPSGNLVIASGTTGFRDVVVNGDHVAESDETLVVEVYDLPDGITLASGTSAEDSIVVEDVTNIRLAAPAAGAVAEGNTKTLTVELSENAPEGGVSVPVVLHSPSTASAADVMLPTVAVAGGASTGTGTFTAVDDNLHEGAERAVLVVGAVNGYTTAQTGRAVDITDNDAAPTMVTLSVAPSTVSEGDGSTAVTVTATVGGATRWAEAQTVRVSVAGSGGSSVVGFAAVADFDLTIPAGADSGTADFNLVPTVDATETGDETITVSGALTSVTVSSADLTVADDDGDPPLCTAASTAVTATNPTDAAALAGDCAILLGAKATLEGSAPTTALNWAANLSMASWNGVTVAGDRVTWLSVTSSQGLHGTIPDLSGLSALTQLRLRGSKTRKLTGGFPTLPTGLEQLDLAGNALAGAIPDLSGYASLTHLHLSNNAFTGSVPSLPTTLETLEIVDNALTGAIPALGGLTSLVQLDLTGNGLTGGLPALPASLVQLRLIDNELSGAISDLSGLTSLERVQLDDNDFTGLPSAFPATLQRLHIRRNTLAGAIPDLSGLAALVDVRLDQNALTGSVPAAAALPPNVELLLLGGNELAGAIPDLSSLTSLDQLWLNDNELTGSVPAAAALPAGLNVLLLQRNNLSGTLPDLSGLAGLTGLHLHLNALTGALPTAFPANLETLHLAGNPVTGGIPSQLGGLTSLATLSLCGTNLDTTATLPAALETRRTADPATLAVSSCVSVADASATEGTALGFSVERSTFPVRGAAGAAGLTLMYETADGTATAADYTGTPADTPGSVTIPGNTTTTTWTSSATVSVATTTDDAAEGDETMTVRLIELPAGAIGIRATATGTIMDPSPAAVPEVTIARTSAATLTEGGSATFRVTAAPPPTADLTVNLTVADAPNGNFVASSNEDAQTVTVPSSGTATHTVATEADTTDEPSGPVTVTVAASAADPATYTIGDAAAASVTAMDNDPTAVTLARSGSSAIAENGTATVTVTLGRNLAAGETVTAPLAVSGAGITAADYTLAAATGANLNAGVSLVTTAPHSAAAPAVAFTGHDVNTVRTATLTLTARDDDVDEGASETLTLSFGTGMRAVTSNLDRATGTGAGGTRPTGTASVPITDNDSALCSTGSTAVTATNPDDPDGLARDCAILLGARSTLEGSSPTIPLFDWVATGSMAGWTGVTLADDRVSGINLALGQGLQGTIPDLSGLTGLTLLRILGSETRKLTGGFPTLPASLRQLDLAGNALSGTIPDLTGYTSLTLLELERNAFTGSVPALPASIRTVNIADNALSGAIPGLGGLTSLRTLDLGRNGLTGGMPALPASLVELRLLDNELSGTIPALSGLTGLQELDLGRNGFSGALPALPATIQRLRIPDNRLSGPIPDLSAPPLLLTIDLRGNALTGAVPAAAALPALVFELFLSGNELTGAIPDLSGLTGLVLLWLDDNGLTGAVPTASALPAGLGTLRLQGNGLTGTVPDLSGRTALTRLNLQRNALTGALPTAWPASLERLHLAGNPVTGGIPSQLGSLTSLATLSLCGTNLDNAATLPAALETRRTADPATLAVSSCVSVADASATEGTALGFSVERSTFPVRGAVGAAGLTLMYATADGTAGAADYTGTSAGSPGSVTIPGNTTTTTWTSSATISVATATDSAAEGDETMSVRLIELPSGVIGIRTTATGTITNVAPQVNRAPVFDSATQSRSVAENAAANAVVGAAIPAATDADGDPLTYSFGGADAGSFTFNTSTRQISTRSGITYDFEAKSTYTVTVTADDGRGGMAVTTVTITLTDMAEPPVAPATPTVTAAAGSTTSLTVTWTAPANAGKPNIASYDLRYRVGSSGAFTNGPQNVTGVTTTITGLAMDTGYEVQVRATNAEGDSPWSASGSGSTSANAAPTFASPSQSRSIAENTATVTNVGAAIPAATDADSDSLTYAFGGADAGSFTFNTGTRQISTRSGITYDFEAKSTYTVTVTADDGNGGTAVTTVTITLTDVAEPPVAPATPTVTAAAGSTTSLTVTWSAPANAGKPNIASYDLRYRVGSTGAFANGPQNVTGTTSTITGLTADTAYEVQVRATNAEGDSPWSASGSGSTSANSAPTFPNATATRSIAENTATVTNVGTAIPAATDADSDSLTYTFGGADAGSFTFNTGTRQISTRSGITYDFEAKSTYTVTVTADDSNGGTAVTTVTITLTDVAEPPVAPGTPTVTAAAGSTTSLTVTWTAPANAGKPNIASYDLQYRVGSSGAFTNGPQNVTGTTSTITGLTADTAYEVQVRATNDEGDSPWSASGSGSTSANSAPTFPNATASRSIAENTATVTNVGAAIPAATDADSDSLTYAFGGADAGSFTFNTGTRQISTRSGITYDFEAKSTYTVTVTADDSNGGTAVTTVTITLTDVAEPPVAPATPTVTAASGSTTSLSVTWSAPANAGKPNIASYDLRYRVGASGAFTNGPQNVTGTTSTITGLTANTAYEVQVRATNAEGDSPWSASGSGSTSANAAPTFASPSQSRSIAENTATVTNVGAAIPAATDADGDPLTYSFGGADAGSFTFNTSTRQISTRSGITYDFEAKSTYTVTVTADDGRGGMAVTTVTITLTDMAEPPVAPATPTVTAAAGSTTSLTVTWTAPANAGKPNIASYDLRYRVGSSGAFTNGPQNVTGVTTTITGLAMDTGYEVQVRATNAEGDSPWSASGTGSTSSNAAPTFANATATRSIAENTATVTNVGAAIPAATDADGDPLSYAFGGADAGSFTFNTGTRRISTRSGITYDFEAKSTYTVTVTADDGRGGTAVTTVTITLTDVAEPPAAPSTPTVTAASGTTTSLTVTWTAPANAGKPNIASYDLRYRVGSSGAFANGPQNVTGTTSTITGLTADTAYEVQVRATNAEGDSPWSASGSGSTSADDDTAPVQGTPTITIAAAPSPVTEGAAATFTLTANPPPTADLDVSLTVTDPPGSDFRLDDSRQTATIAADEASATHSVRTDADSFDERNGPLTVEVNSGSGYTVGAPNSARVTVLDDDPTTVQVLVVAGRPVIRSPWKAAAPTRASSWCS